MPTFATLCIAGNTGHQDLLGKSMLILNRHAENITDMTVAEWTAPHEHIRQVRAATDAILKPDHYNFAFLMNFVAHVHLHVLPRYASPRDRAGITFLDPGFGALWRQRQEMASAGFIDSLRQELKSQLSS